MAEFAAIDEPHGRIHQLISEIIDLKEAGDDHTAEKTFEQISSLSDQIEEHIDTLARAIDK